MTSRQGKEVSSERQYRGNGTSPGMREAVSDSFKNVSAQRGIRVGRRAHAEGVGNGGKGWGWAWGRGGGQRLTGLPQQNWENHNTLTPK